MLERKVKTDVLNWLQNSKHALLITGARQIGKTYLIRHTLTELNKPFLELNFIENPSLVDLFNDAATADEVIMRLTLVSNVPLIEHETIIFFDEVQECKEIVTIMKFLVEDGRYRFILSGSLLGIELSNIRSFPVGYLDIINMYPLDLEEFFRAVGINNTIIELIKESFRTHKPIDDFIHHQLMSVVNMYLVIGGMPEAVQEYITSNDLAKVTTIQESIIRAYKADFTRYERDNKLKLINVYDAIPSELEEKNKRFFVNKIGNDYSFERNKDSFIWLKDAGVALPVYNVTEPKDPLLISVKRNLFKLFLSDVGILTSIYGNDVKIKILSNNVNINNGGLYENLVAQELYAHGIAPYYFNSKQLGELDFVFNYNGKVIPLEVKSGKDYKKHSALNNVLSNSNYELETGIVLCNDNLQEKNNILYLPIYMILCFEKEKMKSTIIKLNIDGLK